MATSIYLQDSSTHIWALGINDSGQLTTIPVSSGIVAIPILRDFQTGLTAWQIGVNTSGMLTTTNISLSPSLPSELPLLSNPSNILFGLSISPAGMLIANQIMASTAGSIINTVKSILNDSAGYYWNFNLLLPFLQLAYQDLSQRIQINQIPIIRQEVKILNLPANTTVIALGTNPGLPANLINPIYLEERLSGGDDTDWIPMEQRDSSVDEIADIYLNYWWWDGYQINFVGSTSNEDIKMKYMASLWLPNNQSDYILPRGVERFLEHQTAHYAADSLYDQYKANQELGKATLALEEFIRAQVQSQQGLPVRRIGYRRSVKGFSNFR